jgi:DNA-binding NarL/FixJ family response regulator
MYSVLVVDDSPDSLSLINDILEHEGINTLVALEGNQAITIAERIKPDLILLDAVMPKLDGFETCIKIKQNRELKHIPIIFMTGLSDSASILKGLNAGGVDYVTKPVNPEELLARIKIHVGNAQIASSAQQALDSIGQNLFAVNLEGDLLWATPQALDFISNFNNSEQWLNDLLRPHLVNLIKSNPKDNATVTIEYKGGKCNLHLVSHRSSGECICRLSHYAEVLPGEDRLKQALNLTAREAEVLFWLSNGKANKEIAQILNIGARTVNKHLEQVFAKLNVENRTTAAGIAIRILSEPQ